MAGDRDALAAVRRHDLVDSVDDGVDELRSAVGVAEGATRELIPSVAIGLLQNLHGHVRRCVAVELAQSFPHDRHESDLGSDGLCGLEGSLHRAAVQRIDSSLAQPFRNGGGLLESDIGQGRICGLAVVAHDAFGLTMTYQEEFHVRRR